MKKEMIYQSKRIADLLYTEEYKGYDFYVVSLGTHPCCYIKLPLGNKYYNKCYDDIELNVHGGLTYASDTLKLDNLTITGWIIGWDYAHLGDYYGYDIPLSHFSIEYNKQYTTDELINDCKNAIDQLIENDEINFVLHKKGYGKENYELQKILSNLLTFIIDRIEEIDNCKEGYIKKDIVKSILYKITDIIGGENDD